MDKHIDMSQEYSEEFDRLRRNRIEVGFYKYGPAKENFSTGNVNAIATMQRCLKKYQETGNTEYLLDASNYLMFEYIYPQHPKAHFKSTDSGESAGIVGLSVNEAKMYEY